MNYDRLGRDRTYVIAEIGGNFTTYEQAVALVDAAVDSGVDCVKLQTYKAETISSKGAYFDMEATGRIPQYDYFKKYELSEDLQRKIFDYIFAKGVDRFSTPSHPDDVDLLIRLGIKSMKLGADDATNIPFLRYVAKTGLPIVLSTGLCNMEEVHEAIDTIRSEGNKRIVLLHTVSGYPTYPDEVNLNVLHTYREVFPDLFIGFSDHTMTTEATIAAAAMGADVVERHFTLDKNAEGPDHRISSLPAEMKTIVDTIRLVEKMKGSLVKEPFGSEVKNRENNRKSVVAILPVKAGELLTSDNVYIKRPGTGLHPRHYYDLLGKRARRDLQQDELITWDDVAP